MVLKYACTLFSEAALYKVIPYICTYRVKWHMLGTYAYVQKQADILLTYVCTQANDICSIRKYTYRGKLTYLNTFNGKHSYLGAFDSP